MNNSIEKYIGVLLLGLMISACTTQGQIASSDEAREEANKQR
jgi:hypothetical protein